MAGYVGWVPGKDAPSQPAAPSEEDIQGLYRDLDFDPQAHENSGRPAGSCSWHQGICSCMPLSLLVIKASQGTICKCPFREFSRDIHQFF